MIRILKSAIIGCGGISRVHVENLKQMQGTHLIAAVDIQDQRAERVHQDTGAAAYTDWQAMLDIERPDVVHLCTPHYLHVPMAVKALSMGIHVLTEKPCAMTLEQLAELRAAQQASTAQLGVCFQNRYNQSSLQMERLVQEQRYGKLLCARAFVTWSRGAEYFHSGAWRGTWAQEGGGVMINQAIHTLDLMQHLCGGIEKIQAHIFNDSLQSVIEVEDSAAALFTFANGVKGVFYATIAYSGNAPVVLELQFEQATLRLERDHLYLSRDSGPMELLTRVESEQTIGKSYWGTGHKALIYDFYDCVQTNRPFPIDAFAGGKAVEAVLGMYQASVESNKMNPFDGGQRPCK